MCRGLRVWAQQCRTCSIGQSVIKFELVSRALVCHSDAQRLRKGWKIKERRNELNWHVGKLEISVQLPLGYLSIFLGYTIIDREYHHRRRDTRWEREREELEDLIGTKINELEIDDSDRFLYQISSTTRKKKVCACLLCSVLAISKCSYSSYFSVINYIVLL
jgi:hypothetical protein